MHDFYFLSHPFARAYTTVRNLLIVHTSISTATSLQYSTLICGSMPQPPSTLRPWQRADYCQRLPLTEEQRQMSVPVKKPKHSQNFPEAPSRKPRPSSELKAARKLERLLEQNPNLVATLTPDQLVLRSSLPDLESRHGEKQAAIRREAAESSRLKQLRKSALRKLQQSRLTKKNMAAPKLERDEQHEEIKDDEMKIKKEPEIKEESEDMDMGLDMEIKSESMMKQEGKDEVMATEQEFERALVFRGR